MLFVPNLILDYTTSFEKPSALVDYIGILVGAGGLALCLMSITRFRSLPKVLCLDAGELTNTGPYRWSRNPQYVGWILFLLGYALTDWSFWCFAALLALAVSLHLLVLVEEEHLRRVFGEPYIDFCRRVPRYFRWRHLRF
jgi:protein-S-isoprenylcysteine O-methyltransferase Ste14